MGKWSRTETTVFNFLVTHYLRFLPMPAPDLVLVSACLAGLQTRYDSRIVDCPDALEELRDAVWIPVCPEQLGGLPTPSQPADLVDGDGTAVLDGHARVICRDGEDVTAQFIRGAEMVLDIAVRQGAKKILLKARSPSCGVAKTGVTAALLIRHGFEVAEFE